MQRAFNKALLGGVSVLALLMTSDLGEARSLTPGANTVVPTAAATQAAIAAAQQSAGAAAQAQASLARAAAAVAAARNLQLDAAAAARNTPSPVPNGLGTGGLMPAGGTSSDPLAGIVADRSKWLGAQAPRQATNGAEVKVDIDQTQPKAILNWRTFNVGSNTTVNFNQSASDWIALNRVQDPGAAPSQILGKINAPGAVYIINRNGIIFGAGSQTNVHTLIASSLDIGQLGSDLTARDQYFLNTGIANLNSFSIYDETGNVQSNLVAGDVKVERGASITAKVTTDLVKLGSPGSVFLFGANVSNSGTISTPTGEVAMVAARTIDVVPNGYSLLPDAVLGRDSADNPIKFRGSEFRLSQFASSYSDSGYSSFGYLEGTGNVTHDGLIEASRGNVVMNGDRISIDNPRDALGNPLIDSGGRLVQGVISVDTGIERNSMVLLRAATSVTMNGVISSLPYDDGATLASGTSSGSTAQSFTPAYVEMSAQSTVELGSNALISAPSAHVVLRAIGLGTENASAIYKQTAIVGDNEIFAQRLFNQGADPTNGQGGNPDVVSSTPQLPKTVRLSPGATIDVAGLQNVELPASYNFIWFEPRAEFADMPLQRLGALYGERLWIDIRARGTRADGTTWVGTPLADASGYVNNVGRSIYQLMTAGGNVSLSTDLSSDSGGSRVETAGSVMNLAGGSVKFLPGMVNTTRLIGADGRIYDMAHANPNMTYLGIAGRFTRNHERWGVTETWTTGSQMFSPGYTEGHDAGGVSITSVLPSLNGTMYFGSAAGERQIAAGLLPLQGSLVLTTPSTVQIGTTASSNYTSQSASTTVLSAATLSGYGLSALTITANDLVLSGGSTLNLAPGGRFTATTGGAIDVAGTISANGGSIDLVTDRLAVGRSFTGLFTAPRNAAGEEIAANVFVSGTLDVSGRFVNDTGLRGTDMQGHAYIDGGSISITTNKNSRAATGGYADMTGSILLAEGSVLDVSSGGYISSEGKPRTAATGVLEGKGGSISLAIYQGLPWTSDTNQIPVRPTPGVSDMAVLQLDGRLLGYGFERNGNLRLAGADTIRIGGNLQPGETSAIRIGGAPSTLPVALLNGGGFGAYTIESVTDDWSGAASNIIISAGVNLNLRQQNLSSIVEYTSVATGTRLGQQAAPLLASLPEDQRAPVDLHLRGDNVLFDTGSVVATDPAATITVGAINVIRTMPSDDPIRNVPAQNVELRGSIVNHGGTVFINALRTHLASTASVDLSGAFVANSHFGTLKGPLTSGKYLAGGTFAVEAGFATATSLGGSNYAYEMLTGASHLVADAGARLDVSGAAGLIDVMNGRDPVSLWSWSDAGTVSANVAGFAWGGSFAAVGGRSAGATQGDPRANGGTFRLGGNAISLRQDMTDVNAALAAFNGQGMAPSSLIVAADQLSQFDNVYLYAANAMGGAARIFTDIPGTLYGNNLVTQQGGTASPKLTYRNLTITGALDFNVANRLEIAAGQIGTSGTSDTGLTASYVMLTGGGSAAETGASTLTVRGNTIDVEGASFSGFRNVSLISSGDLRLSTPKVVNGIIVTAGDKTPTESSTFAGKMVTAGDFLLSAQRIYPVSAVNFTIETPGDVTFAAPAGSNTRIPLSAGGGITVLAENIVQGGNLFAPLGTITLGNIDPAISTIATQSVTLMPGSLTSVSLADTVVPYGATSDGTGWYYNASLNPLSRPPSKGLVLAGTNVTRSDGSTIDLRGGGDLQAMEWIQGQGGSRDTLTTTPSGQTVYALVPSRSDGVAAFDIHFTAARSADAGRTVTPGDAYPMAGTQITIDGGNGIPAGTYTLYPAHYATLPGAMRVVHYGDNTGRNVPTGTALPDGTVLVTGHYTQSALPGRQSSGQSLFAVQANSVWRQYSEYSLNGANAYFTQQAAKQNVVVPRLPADAGRLAAFALQSIVLNGIALTQPGRDSNGNIGRGSELDISAPQLAVLGHAGYVGNDIPAGYVGLDVTQLNGFESVLIGGFRTDTATGTQITSTASHVLVDTKGEAFSAPEILLVATAARTPEQIAQDVTVTTSGGTTQGVTVNNEVLAPVANSGEVTVVGGSVITTTGVMHAGAGRNYYLAGPSVQDIAAALGGTLDATGTVITNADLARLNYTSTGPNGAIVNNAGSTAAGTILQNYASQSGALFVASNDASLKVSGPATPPSLTIRFAASTNPDLAGAVNGSLVLSADAGRVTIGPAATITTQAMTVQATASVQSVVINTNDLHVGQLNVTAHTIGLGSPTTLIDRSAALYNLQFTDVGAVALRAISGTVTFYGDYNPGLSVKNLALDAAALIRADNAGSANVTVHNGTIELRNSGSTTVATSSPATLSGAGLSFEAFDIVLGGGAQSLLGYSQVNLNAANRVFVAGAGAMTLGKGTDVVDLAIATPQILVGGATAKGSSSFAVSTLGDINVVNTVTRDGVADRPADSGETGGNLSLSGGNVTIGSTIQAQAGTITLEATTGDVTLAPRAYLSAAGYKKTLVDVDTHMAGGKVVLKSVAGNVTTSALSVIDVAQPAGGLGYGGQIEVSATAGDAMLAGAMRGSGGPGLGGSFKLDIKGAADLTSLADRLLAAGITGSIAIHTRTGNLTLQENHTLKAHAILLTADDKTWVGNDVSRQLGQIYIGGLIDARGYEGETLNGAGQAGGAVALYGANGVTLASSGVIDASTIHADERGGDVVVGIGWEAKSKIYLQQGTRIDVSGGAKGGVSGGTVTFRAPRDGNNDVRIAGLSAVRNANGSFDEIATIDSSTVRITGARSVAVDGYVAIDTQQGGSGIDGSGLGWNGIIDPAGWYNPDGSVATDGSWTGITGWRPSTITSIINNFTSVPPDVAITGGGGSGATARAVMGVLKPAFGVSATVSGSLSPDTQYSVTFAAPAGGVAAQGTVSTDASGQINIASLVITSAGSGYTSAPTGATIGGLAASFTGLRMQIVGASIVNMGNGNYNAGGAPSVQFRNAPGESLAIVNVAFTQGSNFSGKTTNGTFTADTDNFIPWRSSGVFGTFDPATQGTAGIADFTGGATSNRPFFDTVLTQITQGTWTHNGQSYGFGNLYSRLQPLVDQLGAGVVHVKPGVELVNSNGAIDVKTNWNLAAGTAGNLQTQTVNNQTSQYFDPNLSHVNFNYRLATPWGGLEAGALALRAAGNINVNASISDGFFQFGNYLDPNYVASLGLTPSGGVVRNVRVIDQGDSGGLYAYYLNTYGAVPFAPYQAAANGISPTGRDLSASDLFPNALRVCTIDCSTANIRTIAAPSSWSYSITAGSDVSSADPTARVSLADASTGNRGDVIVDGHSTYRQTLVNDSGGGKLDVLVDLPTMIRTGSGNIAISAARDVILKDLVAPGVIYAAGVNSAPLPGANYTVQTVDGVSRVVALNPDGFFEPRVLGYGNGATRIDTGTGVNDGAGGRGLYDGPPTAAAFPEQGGDVTIDARRDIIGYAGSDNKVLQYYQPWLLSNTGLTPSSAGGSIRSLGAGVFAPSGAQIASQTAWWIQYGSFQQGILSAGGNVSVFAGRDLKDVSVSLPSTGRVSGGLAAGSTPVTHLYGSGNMLVRAGRDILGGSFYEGSGSASIMAGGAIGANGTVSRYATSNLRLDDVPLLAVDTGQIEMIARGSIAMAGVVNPAALHAQQSSSANPLQSGVSTLPLYMTTYGPDSKVRLVAAAGDVDISIAPTAIADLSLPNQRVNAMPALYPASLEALALNGSLITKGIQVKSRDGQLVPINQIGGSLIPMPGIMLSPSAHGTFQLLARDNVDLTFGYPQDVSSIIGLNRPFISAGAALLETAFDPYQPNSGFGGTFNGAVLAHQDDEAAGLDTVARIYAATGDIKATGSYGQVVVNGSSAGYQRVEINRPTRVYAGQDIVDLNIIVQNIRTGDVSSIEAGRNITYTGFNNGGGLQVAGPGFFVVQAGGDIGPFLPAAHNNPSEAPVQEGIASVGNSSPTPVGNIYVSSTGGSVGIYNQSLLGPTNNPRRNALLTAAAGTSQGADLITLFGTRFGIDHQAVINAYIDPAGAAGVVHNYIPELQAFLVKIGKPASATDAATVFSSFLALPQELQHVFVAQVFFAELKAVGINQEAGAAQFRRGYEMINTMFPSRLGYTANALGGGSNGANELVRTGDLNLLHATVQTQLGGDISIFGPGGNLIVGSLAIEPNTSLQLRDLGILTLGGGAINTFTDGSVLVNSSRVLTTQGGDVMMWSSNGDLDAGRGSKTTLSAPALQVQFDQNDYQSIDLGGFVTGSGIGTLQASSVAEKSNLYLVAPRGTIDAGSAGIRVSGNATFVAPVIANASNISVQGTSTGIPMVSVPNIGALTAGSNTAGAATRTAEAPTASGNRERASVFIVEVVGYGGGDGQSSSDRDKKDDESSDKPQQ